MLFSQFIENYRSGTLDDMLGKELQKIVGGCQHFAKMGELKLSIKIKPKNTGEAELDIKFTSKVPSRDQVASIMFMTPEGRLLNNDPIQSMMNFETGEILEAQNEYSKTL